MDKKSIVNIENKFTLTVKEAAEYFNIGENRIREMSDQNDCHFVLWVGSKRLIKRKKFEDHLNGQYSI